MFVNFWLSSSCETEMKIYPWVVSRMVKLC